MKFYDKSDFHIPGQGMLTPYQAAAMAQSKLESATTFDKVHEAGFDHPCRGTCSGWQQGFTRGISSFATAIKKLLKPEEAEYFEKVISRAKFEYDLQTRFGEEK